MIPPTGHEYRADAGEPFIPGRAGIGDVELTENEWGAACNQREHYWLYVRAKGGVVIDEREIFSAAEDE
jgi:hypothetical protein